MPKEVTAILIDPETQEIMTTKIKPDLDAIYKKIKCDTIEAHTILSLGLPVIVIADEEFWMKKQNYGQKKPATIFPGCMPLCGKILLFGEGVDGEDFSDAPISVRELSKVVTFAEYRR